MDSLKLFSEKTRQPYDLAAQAYHELFHDEMRKKDFDIGSKRD